MSSLSLFNDVNDEISSLERALQNMPKPPVLTPPSPISSIEKIRFANTGRDAEIIYGDIASLFIVSIGCDTEFATCDRQIKLPRSKKPWTDIRSIRPLLATFAVLAKTTSGLNIVIRLAFDLRCSDVLPWVDKILQLLSRLTHQA